MPTREEIRALKGHEKALANIERGRDRWEALNAEMNALREEWDTIAKSENPDWGRTHEIAKQIEELQSKVREIDYIGSTDVSDAEVNAAAYGYSRAQQLISMMIVFAILLAFAWWIMA